MAEFKQCKECYGMFLYTTNNQLCFCCSQRNEQEFQKIKAYLRLHPKSSIGTIATELDISVATIQKFIDEGRLEMLDTTVRVED